MTAAGSSRGSVIAFIKRWRFLAAIGLALLLISLLGLLITRPDSIAPLDPKNSGPQGAQALFRILQQQGVEVTVTNSYADVERDLSAQESTLLLARPDLLAASRGPDLARLLQEKRANVVIIDPGNQLLADLGLPVGQREIDPPSSLPPQCDLPDPQRAGTVTLGGFGLPALGIASESPWSRTGCYSLRGVSTFVQLNSSSGQQITLIGSGAPFMNASLANEGNAALALGVLGDSPKLLWWTPSPVDVPTSTTPKAANQSLRSLLPAGITWASWYLLPLLAITMLWRGRRMGRLSTEPLPITVRAIETTLGRATLYRRTRGRGRAAQILRAATVRRLAVRWGLPRTSPPELVAAAIAHALGQSEQSVLDLLIGPDPVSDLDLVRLAQRLTTLEKEAIRS